MSQKTTDTIDIELEKSLFQSPRQWIFLLIVSIFFFFFPTIFGLSKSLTLLFCYSFLTIIAVNALNILIGRLGLGGVCFPAIIGFSAYNMYFLNSLCNQYISPHFEKSFEHLWPINVFFCGLSGLLILGSFVFISARLKHSYFFVFTLVFQLTFEWFIARLDVVNHGDMVFIPRVWWLGEKIQRKEHLVFFYRITFVTMVFFLGSSYTLLRGVMGRAFHITGHNETVARSLGISIWKTNFFALAYCGLMLGVVGGLRALLDRGVGLESFTISQGFEHLAMVLVGGIGHFSAPLIGAPFIIGLGELITFVANVAGSGGIITKYYASIRPLTIGLSILMVLFFFPQGPVPALKKWIQKKIKKT